jgi:predicted aconitase
MQLTAAEERMLGGRDGDGVALAMRVVVGQARILAAPRLVEITSAHVDSCLYHGQVSLDFAHRLVDLGAAPACRPR